MIKVTVYLSEKEKSNPSVPVQFYADSFAEFTSNGRVVYWGFTADDTSNSKYFSYVLCNIVGFFEEAMSE
jgi:hypothetical protein